MPSLAELTATPSVSQVRTRMVDRLAGRGRITHTGTGSGQLSISGAPTESHDVEVTIASDTGSGVTFSVAVDGTTTVASASSLKGATYTHVSLAGVSLYFDAGSYTAGDTYEFQIAPSTIPTTAWQPGSTPLALLESEADPISEAFGLVSAVASGGLLEYASGDWLTLLAKQVYGLDRNPATATKGFIRLTNASATPQTIAVGQLWFSDLYGHRYTNTAGGTLAAGPGTTLDLAIQAEQTGASWNVASGQISQMVTPLPGVTCTNPTDWLSRTGAIPGADIESDDLLKQRCRDRWSSLGVAATEATYRFWARSAHPSVQQVAVLREPSSPGTVVVYIAGAGGSQLSFSIGAVVDAYIRERMPLTSNVWVAPATPHSFTVSGTVYVSSAKASATQAAIAAALQAYINNAPIGGYTGSSSNIISLEKIIGLIAGQDGVVDATITSPTANVVLSPIEVPKPTYSLTYVQVP